ncbi:3-phosphoserine/phosphohydroxythreonine transaminase [Leptolyngbya cf. ectocarpi LEGE 11479]|uniref:Phosphoserine aminotransferase n=1 Tax=Leptolyngbya cf. ectocarpi LEGE 11479 TaxID=1828722 RepID=A0A928ZVN9_LEPEC|nr:3-phosphoserine/phosphohydroxythreonine transaminase [Leptolyngbya cf. ectocarpi LEGE 11479]
MNFYPGPGALPLPVLKRIHTELFNFDGTGMSVMEISHRNPKIQFIIDDSVERIKRLMTLNDEFDVIFLQGGGSLQFLMVPMNFSEDGDYIDYIDTGYWAEKAIRAAKGLDRDLEIIASSADSYHTKVPNLAKVQLREKTRYLHLCSNNTVVGTQFHDFPKFSVPVVVDMSSDFMSKSMDTTNLSCIYAHAQKNIGLSGVTVVLIRKEMLTQVSENLPEFLDYRTHIARRSNYHTPPCFSIYVMWHILRWIEEDMGGLNQLGEINQKKADLLYNFIDSCALFDCPVEKQSRSQMNVVFTLPSKDLEQQFIQAAAESGIVGVAGHRTKGGCRVSLYNGVTIEAVSSLTMFMEDFAQNN